jgi:hypothetical protein
MSISSPESGGTHVSTLARYALRSPMLPADCDIAHNAGHHSETPPLWWRRRITILFLPGRCWTELNPPMLVRHHLGQIALAGPAINQADDECPHDRTLHLIRPPCRSRRFQDGFKVQGKWYRRSGKSFRRGIGRRKDSYRKDSNPDLTVRANKAPSERNRLVAWAQLLQ